MKEELGDLLFQVIFHAQIGKEKGEFSIEEVLEFTIEKMIRRHPHVFGGAKVKTAREALARWESLKTQEKRNKRRKSVLDGVPRQLPALLRARQLQSRAARVGFDWTEWTPVWLKVREEMEEVEESLREGHPPSIEAELGDVFFSLVNAARFLKIDPEEALRKANQRFSNSFQTMEGRAKRQRRSLADMGADEMEQLWEEAKKANESGRRPLRP